MTGKAELLNQIKEEIPSLTDEEKRSLKRSIKEDGQIDPILVDQETGMIVDGEHRREICDELGVEPKVLEKELNQKEALRLALTRNFSGRNISKEKAAFLIKSLRQVGFTQKEVAELMGLSQARISQMEKANKETEKNNVSNINSNNTNNETKNSSSDDVKNTDKRVKLSEEDRKKVNRKLKEGGKTQEEIAKEVGVSRPRIAQVQKENTLPAKHMKSWNSDNIETAKEHLDELTDEETEFITMITNQNGIGEDDGVKIIKNFTHFSSEERLELMQMYNSNNGRERQDAKSLIANKNPEPSLQSLDIREIISKIEAISRETDDDEICQFLVNAVESLKSAADLFSQQKEEEYYDRFPTIR